VGSDGTLASFNPNQDVGTLSYTYYSVGAGHTLTALAGAPTAVGSYAVIGHYTSDNADYGNADSAEVDFSITVATPAVTVTDNGGVYNGNSFPVTAALVTGVGSDGTLASFNPNQDVGALSYSYYSVGAGHTLTLLAAAPTAVGNYAVVGHYTSDNANYANADSAEVDFSITFQNIQISGYAFNDTDGNPATTADDVPLAGWTINLGGSASATTTTDSSGYYHFDNLGPGTYTLSENVQSGWTQTFAPSGSITAQSGTNVANQNFGNFQNVSISGTVWNDKNDNQQIDSGEPGNANVGILLDGVAAATTDMNGNYTITNVGPGPHTITQIAPPGNLVTTPTTDSYTLTPSSGTNVGGLNFGDVAISFSKDNGQTGAQQKGGGWATLTAGWNGSSRTHDATDKKNVSAQWQFTRGIPNGAYEVFVSYQTDPSRDPAATYTVYDGGLESSPLLGTVAENQQNTPASGIYGGVMWQKLGKFTFTNGKSALVELTVGKNGSVDADGVLLVYVGASTSSGSPAASMGLRQRHSVIHGVKRLGPGMGSLTAAPLTIGRTDPIIARLDDAVLEWTNNNSFWIDATAVSRGWGIEPTPAEDRALAAVTGGEDWTDVLGRPAWNSLLSASTLESSGRL
jgi:hypothetical protein